MNINISSKASRDSKKVWYYLEWGKSSGQRRATGIFTWAKPKNQIEKNHNKEALAILESKRSQLVLDQQATNSAYIPQHKIKANFLDYYSDYIKANRKAGNRHLETSLIAFKKFLKKDFISAIDVTENLCEGFRDYLLKKYTGKLLLTTLCVLSEF